MTKIDIFSGFLGAGKTTLIKKLIKEAYSGEKLVLIENEFGKIGIDGGFLREAGIEITEMNSGCICCSLVGDFGEALGKVMAEFSPDRILIEPSGVGKLSDVVKAVASAEINGMKINALTAVIDASKCKMYMKNFAEFYRNQIEHAGAIVLSRTQGISAEKLSEAIALIKEINPAAPLIATPWDELDGKTILATLEKKNTIETALAELVKEHKHHSHHHECDDPDCDCHEHRHHHECDDPDCDCHEHHHHHECDDPDRDCHEHRHHHEDHHHADDIFMSWGIETSATYSVEFIEACLKTLDTGSLGSVLRAKGIVQCNDGGWINFDYVPGEINVRIGTADVIGKLCVIGAGLDKKGLNEFFKV